VSKRFKIMVALASVLHTGILFLLTSWFMSLPWLAGDEKFLIWFTSAIKFQSREMPDPGTVALINVSYDLELIDKFDDFGFPVGNQVITDRLKLYEFFKILNDHGAAPKQIICDIFFQDETPADSLLERELKKRNDLVLSFHLNDQLEPEYPIFEGIDRGLSDYLTGNIFEGVYKYQLFYHDTVKLTPLRVFEKTHSQEIKKWGPFVKIADKVMPNHFILNYRLLQKDIADQEVGFNPINLGELLLLPPQEIINFLDNKIVILGDFLENDFHETLFEITSGPLILLNGLLSLENFDTQINIWFSIILGGFFLFLSYLVFYPGDIIEERIKYLFGNFKFLQQLMGFMSYFLILTACSLITYFIYNIHINVFFLSIYLYLIDKLIGWMYKLKGGSAF